MRALVIPAAADEPIREVELKGDTLSALQALVGGIIEPLPFPGRDDAAAYVNEEGKFDQEANPPNRRASQLFDGFLFAGDWIAGDMVVAGFNARSGNTVALPSAVTVESISVVKMSSLLLPYEPTPLTDGQERVFARLNDVWGVARCIPTPDGNVLIVCEDGDEALVQPNGEWRWTNR